MNPDFKKYSALTAAVGLILLIPAKMFIAVYFDQYMINFHLPYKIMNESFDMMLIAKYIYYLPAAAVTVNLLFLLLQRNQSVKSRMKNGRLNLVIIFIAIGFILEINVYLAIDFLATAFVGVG